MEVTSFKKKFIIALDVGTTNLKCHLYSKNMNLISKRNVKIDLLCVPDGCIEIKPDALWNTIIHIVQQVLVDAGTTADQILCLGISTQRGTFITWDSKTKVPFHNLITWKDLRASVDVMKWNKSVSLKIVKCICYLIYAITGSPRFLTASLFKFTTSQVIAKLSWMLKNNQQLKNAVKSGTAMFGTLDTWLLYRLTNGKSFFSDVSCASSTGMYDPFTMSWMFVKLFGIPSTILPNVCDSAGTHFGNVCSDIWGSDIPIVCSIADQSAALYGSRCFNCGDIKITLGTGGFFNINVGSVAKASKTGFYPLIGWRYQNRQICVLENAFNDCGTLIDWAQFIGFFKNMHDLSRIMKSVEDTQGVYFIPSFFGPNVSEKGLRGAGFIGITSFTKKEHLIRAILESIIFRIYDIYQMHISDKLFKEVGDRCSLRINGGVSNSDFICQSIADICCVTVVRPACVEMTVKGVALLAGHTIGLWNTDDINENFDDIFYPNETRQSLLHSSYIEWIKAQSFLK